MTQMGICTMPIISTDDANLSVLCKLGNCKNANYLGWPKCQLSRLKVTFWMPIISVTHSHDRSRVHPPNTHPTQILQLIQRNQLPGTRCSGTRVLGPQPTVSQAPTSMENIWVCLAPPACLWPYMAEPAGSDSADSDYVRDYYSRWSVLQRF